MDITRESKETLAAYGAEPGKKWPDRITLTGGGISRELIPVDPAQVNPADFYADPGKDFAFGAQFYFRNLPQGDYELRITADGYREHAKTVTVVPGRYEPQDAQIDMAKLGSR